MSPAPRSSHTELGCPRQGASDAPSSRDTAEHGQTWTHLSKRGSGLLKGQASNSRMEIRKSIRELKAGARRAVLGGSPAELRHAELLFGPAAARSTSLRQSSPRQAARATQIGLRAHYCLQESPTREHCQTRANKTTTNSSPWHQGTLHRAPLSDASPESVRHCRVTRLRDSTLPAKPPASWTSLESQQRLQLSSRAPAGSTGWRAVVGSPWPH